MSRAHVTSLVNEQSRSSSAVLYLRVSTKEQAQRDGDPEGYDRTPSVGPLAMRVGLSYVLQSAA